MPRVVLLVVLAAFALGACTSGSTAAGESPAATVPSIALDTTTTTAAALATTTTTAAPFLAEETNLQEFSAALETLRNFAAEWNTVNLHWVSAYADESVGIEEYLEVSYETEIEQRKLLVAFVIASGSFPEEMSEGVDAFIANYQGRADAFHDLVLAEVASDEVAWGSAADRYYALSSADTVIPILRTIMSTPSIEGILAAEGVTVDEFIAAFATALGLDSGG